MDCAEVGKAFQRTLRRAAAMSATDYRSVGAAAPIAEKPVCVAMAGAGLVAKSCLKAPDVAGSRVALPAQDILAHLQVSAQPLCARDSQLRTTLAKKKA